MIKALTFVVALTLSGCVGRDLTKPIMFSQECSGTCTLTVMPVVEPMLSVPVSGLPGGL